MWRAKRLEGLPPYLFVEIDRRKQAAQEAGRDLIDFGIGDPDQPTPDFIVQCMAQAVGNPDTHGYASTPGTFEFRKAAARFISKRFGVDLDPECEVLSLLGSKEGIGHLPTALVNPGETVLVPEPGYPVYASGVTLAGGTCHTMALHEGQGWLPALDEIPTDVARNAKLMYLNYPNNPTGACAPLHFLKQAVAFAREYDLLIAHDAAYSEVYFADPPPSILQVEHAREVCVEFHSLSKTFNMTGWRVAFVVGNRDALSSLGVVKANLDSGIFEAIQIAGIEALRNVDHPAVQAQVETYRRRRDILVPGLRTAGFSVATPQATFYVWAGCPQGLDSMTVASRLLDEADIVAIPGIGFGPAGEGYVRFALTVDEERTREAVQRMTHLEW